MAISFLRSGKASNGNAGSPTTLAITVTVNAGDTVVLIWVTAQSTATPGSFSTVNPATKITNGGNWTEKVAPVTSGSFRASMWATDPGGATAASTLTVNCSGATDNILAIVMVYAGVGSFGTTASATGSTGTSTVSLTIATGGNWVAAGHGSATANAPTLATGARIVTQVQSSTSTNDANAAATDNTAASATSVTNAATLVASEPWAAVALEMIPGAGTVSAPAPLPTLTRSIPFDARYRGQLTAAASALAPAAVVSTAKKVPWHLFPPLTMRQPSRWRRRRAHALG